MAFASPQLDRSRPRPQQSRRPNRSADTAARLHDHGLQAKLQVGGENDPLEREADRVAERVLLGYPVEPLGSAGGAPGGKPSGPQRKCAACEPQRACADCASEEEQGRLQLKAQPGGPQRAAVEHAGAEDAAAALSLGGLPLSRGARAFFEPRFGRDFSEVRVHDHARAHAAAAGINARAYTLGSDIAFAAGHYSPATPAGRQLLAHELAHVIQQGSGGKAVQQKIQRRWDRPSNECDAEPTGKTIDSIVIDQATPQTVTLHWSDASQESFECSTGKGHCCVDPAEADVVGCSVPESRRDGSNCTPITEGAGYPVVDRYLERNTWKFWTEIVPARGIGMHQYPVRDGTPLSHGCVRLAESTARRIFCGVRRNDTKVQVVNFARPLCDHPQLQAEWQGDLRSAAMPTDGEPPAVRRGIRATRKTLREAFRVDDDELDPILATPAADVPATIPRCSYLAPDAESALLEPQPGQSRSAGDRLSRGAGFSGRAAQLTRALEAASSLADAEVAVEARAESLWQRATRRARGGNSDDRPIYWARLQMIEAIRQVRFRFLTSPAERRQLVETFDRVSRGMTTVSYPGATARGGSDKKILISGFDPFNLDPAAGGDPRRGNPSGAAALALDGQRITSGALRGQVQAVIFPVRFADFDLGLVESLFGPFLSGPAAVDMIMTISQGGGSEFEAEQFTGRRRSSGSFADNLGRTAGGTLNAPVEPRGLAAGPEFLETALPTAEIRSSLGRTAALTAETEVQEIPAGGTSAVHRPAGPTGGAAGFTGIAAEGSGGGFLSNEISYRTLLLRRGRGATIPVGHLHTPFLGLPAGDSLSDRAFVNARDGIVRTIRRILEASLPTL